MSSPLNDDASRDPQGAATPSSSPAPASPEAPAAESGAQAAAEPVDPVELRRLVIEALAQIYDPEIPVNIYDLGLIYEVEVTSAGVVEIRMTLTAPGCPAAFILPLEVEYGARAVPGVTSVRVRVVWDPPWTRDRMSEAAKLQLGLL